MPLTPVSVFCEPWSLIHPAVWNEGHTCMFCILSYISIIVFHSWSIFYTRNTFGTFAPISNFPEMKPIRKIGDFYICPVKGRHPGECEGENLTEVSFLLSNGRGLLLDIRACYHSKSLAFCTDGFRLYPL